MNLGGGGRTDGAPEPRTDGASSGSPGAAARRWVATQAGWAVPREILAQAPPPRSPSGAPPSPEPATGSTAGPAAAQVAGPRVNSPSTALARNALGEQGTVLDVGCGTGRAGLSLVPPGRVVTGVDRDAARLEAFARSATDARVAHAAVLGDWPDVRAQVPPVEVVVCHDVVYAVPDLAGFLQALDEAATRRVVVDLPAVHPLVPLAPLWRRFWGIDRPDGPTALDVLDVARELGLPAHPLRWEEPIAARAEVSWERRVEVTRIRLCLPADRDAEVDRALREDWQPLSRERWTIWWDVSLARDRVDPRPDME